MKLIIEIPDHEYKYTCERTLSDRTFWDDAIRNGTPLACVKAEIQSEAFSDRQGDTYIYVPHLFKLLDNIGKAESEDKE